MLHELRVENLLLIERAELRLGPGLNVLTGETGAGKTVLAHALDLLLGGKPRSGIVRPGAAEAYVEGDWHVVDATSLDPRETMVRIATGMDASETAFLSQHHAAVNLNRMNVTAVADSLPSDDVTRLVTLG